LKLEARASFAAHWGALKRTFEQEAPALIEDFFRDSAAADLALIETLVLDGKCARGGLVMLVCEALGGHRRDALPRAVLIECVQAATLVHDDVVDGDAIRRGQPALWTALGQRRAILLGDLLFATALMRAAHLGYADVKVLANAIGTVASGAYREPLDERDLALQVSAATLYERVIHCKTGALFGAAGRLGAIAAHAAENQVDAACAFATRVGEAYQMADDITDLLEDDATADPQRAAALVLLRAHFERGLSPAAASQARDSAPGATCTHRTLAPRVAREIHRRIRLARREIGDLTAGRPSALLHAAPRFLIDLKTPRRDQGSRALTSAEP